MNENSTDDDDDCVYAYMSVEKKIIVDMFDYFDIYLCECVRACLHDAHQFD